MITETSFETKSPLKKAIVAALILAFITMAFFWQILFTPTAWMPAGGGDLVPFLYPNYHFAAQSLRSGNIPLWNPHLYSGLPFAADAQSGLFYPLNLLAFLLIPNFSLHTLEYLVILHFWLAGFAMFLYLQHSPMAQQLKIHPLAALVGAVAFEFSDLFIVHFGNYNMIAVAAWLPLIMLAFQKSVQQKSVVWAIGSGLLLGAASLAGHIQITLFILLAMGLTVLWEVFQPGQSLSLRLNHCKYLLIALIVTVGISALWLIPTLEMSSYTLRADLPYQETAAYSLEPAQLIGLLAPNYFGRDPALHWGPWDRVETGYIGLLTLLLAIMAGFLQANRQMRFLIFLAGISFLLALGHNTILHGWLSLSPGFGQFRAPARYILLLDFALAGLATVTLNELMRGLSAAQSRTYAKLLKGMSWILGGLLVISLPLAYFALLITQDRHIDIFRRAQGAATAVTTFAILSAVSLLVLHLARTGRLKNTALGLSVGAIILLDLFSLGSNVDVGHADPTSGYNHPEALAYLQQNLDINRLEVTTDVWHLWQPDSALLYNLYDAWGLYNPLTLADMTRYWEQVGRRDSPAYNLLGIKYIIASKAGAPADGDIVPVFDADPAINIYLNRNALPRILFVSQTQIVESHEAAWEALKSPDFDPRTQVILEQADSPEALPDSAVTAPAEIARLRYEPETVEIAVTTTAPGYLVLTDSYYPGWKTYLNGEAVPIYRANYAFRAVYVPAGEHVIRFVFEPASWKLGLALTGLTILLLIVGGVMWWKQGAWRLESGNL